jgi:protein ImuB
LFLPSSPDPEKLELTIARLANLVGEANVGAPELADTHRPDAFQMRRFAAPQAAPETTSKMGGANRKASAAAGNLVGDVGDDRTSLTHRRIALRVFRPSLPASVEMGDGRVARVSFNGMRGEVVAATGPWRTSGEWWREDAWEHDEWDIEVRFGLTAAPLLSASRSVSPNRHRGALARSDLFSLNDLRPSAQRGLYCIYYDSVRGGWFVRGMYD